MLELFGRVNAEEIRARAAAFNSEEFALVAALGSSK